MYFLTPGIVSQALGEIFKLDLPPAIDALVLDPATAEVQTATATVSPALSFESYEFWDDALPRDTRVPLLVRAGSANIALYLSSYETSTRQVYPTRLGFKEIGIVGAANLVRTAFAATELSGFEIGRNEISSSRTAYFFTAEIGYAAPLRSIVTAIDLSGVIGSKFLPGSPGYVAGVATPAVEISRVEVGSLPEPLPTGFVEQANEVVGIKAGFEVFSTFVCSNFNTIEIASELNGRAPVALELSVINSCDRKLSVVNSFSEVLIIEATSTETISVLEAPEQTRAEVPYRYLNETVFEAIEIVVLEKSDRPSNKVNQSPELVGIYAAESAITKP